MRHIDTVPRFQREYKLWSCDKIERTRRLIDLNFVSVLLDAGAGSRWRYFFEGTTLGSSEGLGVASVDMFLDGMFSSDPAMPFRVNSRALKALELAKLERAMQHNAEKNPLIATTGRLELLQKLGAVLEEKPEIFGKEVPRPGNLLDFVLKEGRVGLKDLWTAVAHGIQGIWPKKIGGGQSGDIWYHSKLTIPGKPGSELASFHKLTQWLLYSIIEVIETGLGIKVFF